MKCSTKRNQLVGRAGKYRRFTQLRPRGIPFSVYPLCLLWDLEYKWHEFRDFLLIVHYFISKIYYTIWHWINIRSLMGTVLQLVKAWQVHSRFGEMEENAWSRGDAWCAFIQGWGSHPCCKLCVSLMRSPYLLSTKDKHSQQKAKKIYKIAWFCTSEPISCHGDRLSDPVSRLWEHYLLGPFKVAGKLLPLVPQTPG